MTEKFNSDFTQMKAVEFDPTLLSEAEKIELFESLIDEAKENILIADPDLFKLRFQDFVEDHHKYYIKLNDDFFKYVLANDSTRSEVLYTGGGSGSGKTEIIVRSASANSFKGLVCDGTLSNFESYSKHIDRTLSYGKIINIHGAIGDINKAYNYVLKREKQTGRPVPKEVFIRKHQGFLETFPLIIHKYSKLGVTFKLFDNRFENQILQYEDIDLILEVLSEVNFNYDLI